MITIRSVNAEMSATGWSSAREEGANGPRGWKWPAALGLLIAPVAWMSISSLKVPVSGGDMQSKVCDRWLWFVGLSEGKNAMCLADSAVSQGGYYSQYAAALLSSQKHAGSTLVPVLLLGRFGLQNSTELSSFGKWAQEAGAIVLTIPRLAFQEEMVNSSSFNAEDADHRIGPFLRFHIPVAIREHQLFERFRKEGVCQDNVLYTDSDVLFIRGFNSSDVRKALVPLTSHSTASLIYSTEAKQHSAVPENTGVMFMNVPRFVRVWPELLAFGRSHGFSFPSYDQGWLNRFCNQHRGHRVFLHPHWNWKVYWGREKDAEPIVVHFHGPKPGHGCGAPYLDCLASGNASCLGHLNRRKSCGKLVEKGLAADSGAFARVALNEYTQTLKGAVIDHFCNRSMSRRLSIAQRAQPQRTRQRSSPLDPQKPFNATFAHVECGPAINWVQPSQQCAPSLATTQRMLNWSIMHRVSAGELLSSARRREAISMQPAKDQRHGKLSNVLLCIAGVIPRGIRYTWPLIDQHMVVPLRTRGINVDIYGFSVLMGDTVVDGERTNVSDMGIVPFTYLEVADHKDLDRAIERRCNMKTCPRYTSNLFGGEANGGLGSAHDPKGFASTYSISGLNAARQLISENRVGEFLMRSEILGRYDVAVVWWAGLAPVFTMSEWHLIDEIHRAAVVPNGIIVEQQAISNGPWGPALNDGFYIGAPQALSKLLMRWSDEPFWDQQTLGRSYEDYVAKAFSAYALKWLPARLPNAREADDRAGLFTRIRVYGPREKQWHQAKLFNPDAYKIWIAQSPRRMQEDQAHCLQALDQQHRTCWGQADVTSATTARQLPFATDVAILHPFFPSTPEKIGEWAIGNIEVAALVRGSLNWSKALGPPEKVDAYLRTLPKDLLPQTGIRITDKNALFLIRWYRSAVCKSTWWFLAQCAPSDEKSPRPTLLGGKTVYHLPNDSRSQWIPSLRVLSAVKLKRLSHNSGAVYYELPAAEATRLVDLMLGSAPGGVVE